MIVLCDGHALYLRLAGNAAPTCRGTPSAKAGPDSEQSYTRPPRERLAIRPASVDGHASDLAGAMRPLVQASCPGTRLC